MSFPKQPSYLLKRPSGLHFRIKVPADVRSLIGRTELRRSLIHLSEKEAHREAVRLAVMECCLFDSVRDPASNNRQNPFASLSVILDQFGTASNRNQPLSPADKTPETPTLGNMINGYIAEKVQADNWTPKTEHEYRAILSLLSRIIGNPNCCDLSYGMLRNYKTTLSKLPPNLNKMANYKNKSLDELVEMNVSVGVV